MPQPIDFSTESGRVTAAERIQQIADRASLASQHNTRMAEDLKRLQQETQVQETHPGEQEALDADGENQAEERNAKKRAKRIPKSPTGRPDAAEIPVIPEDDAPRFDVKL